MAPNGPVQTPPPAPIPPTPPPGTPQAKRSSLPSFWWLVVIAVLGGALLFSQYDNTKPIQYSPDFLELAREGQIKKFVVMSKRKAWGEVRDPNAEEVKGYKLPGGKFTVNLPETNDQTELLKKLQDLDNTKWKAAREESKDPNNPAKMQIVIDDEPPQFLGPLIWTVLPLVIFIAFFVFFLLPRMRESGGGGFLSSYVRSPAKRYEKKAGRMTFDDVAGMDSAKRELTEVVEFLKTPEKFARLGAQIPKGVLLVGPPGTGKTLLAKAVAGEANVPFYAINGSEFIQMFVGVGASRVRDLFRNAKETAPCVIFIDEIDAVGRMRGAGVGGGSDEREQTLNQILSEMDGFHPNETVIVLAATNRPDVLDAALLRPGRFDRHVTVDRPTWQGRLAILKVHTKNKPLSDNVDLERIARSMIGMSGADLRNLCNEAALVATRGNKKVIEHVDFDSASDRVRLGLKREEKYGDEEKRRTAYHEAGHALCAWFQPKADPLDRVSIVPRGRTGGVTIFTPNEDRIDRSFGEFMADLVVAMGGRAADKLIFGEALSGAIGDIKQATRLARAMVTQYGMSDRLGPVYFRQGEDHVFLGKEISESRDFSEGTARIIDEEIQRILTAALKESEDLLKQHQGHLHRVADALLMHEELDREEVRKVIEGVPLAELRRLPKSVELPVLEAPPKTDTDDETLPNSGLAFGGA